MRVLVPLLLMTLSASAQTRVFLGHFSGRDPNGAIQTATFDPATGTLGQPEPAAPVAGAGFLAISPDGKTLYATAKGDQVLSFAVAPDGKLALLDTIPVTGGPCQLELAPSGKWLAVSNYGGGSFALIDRKPDGRLGGVVSTVQNAGSGPKPKRQEKPHAHCAMFDPTESQLVVADLGIDRVVAAAIAEDGTLTPQPENDLVLPPGSGPRYLAASADNRHWYLANELSNDVTTITRENGKMEATQTSPTLPPDFKEENTVAHIDLHPNQRWVYATNRGHNSIVRFVRDPDTGRLSNPSHFVGDLARPWHFSITPDGRWMVVANTASGTVRVLAIDPEEGTLSAHGDPIAVKNASCVVFAPTP